MYKIPYLGLFAKISLLVGATGIFGNSSTEETTLNLYQGTLNQGVALWNDVVSRWNSGDKNAILQEAKDSIFYRHMLKNFPQESALIMEVAESAESMPVLNRVDDSTLHLQNADTGEILLELSDLDKIKNFDQVLNDNSQ